MTGPGVIRISGGDLRGRELRVPEGLTVRPMRSRIRESLFNAIGRRLSGALFLDGFAGSGAVGIEALSRGAWRVVHVESDRRVGENLARNLVRLQLCGQCQLTAVDLYDPRSATNLLSHGPFDLVFLDPPFGDYQADAKQRRDPWQLAERLATELLKPGGWIGLEYPSRLAAPAPPVRLTLAFDRRYGETSIVIWQRDSE